MPPSQLSSWEKYFLDQFRIAFPAHNNEAEQETIFRLFDALRPDQVSPPTPRQIKLFLNTLGALHRQWRGVLPLATQAAFCLTLLVKRDFAQALKSSDTHRLLPFNIDARLPENWQRDMAALYYNVAPSFAFEALLGYPVLNSLRHGNGKALAELESGPGFCQVLVDVLERQYTLLPEMDQHLLVNAVNAMTCLQGQDDRYRFCWRTIGDQIRKIERWDVLNERYISAITGLLQADPSYDVAPIADSLLRSLFQKNGKLLTEDELEAWSRAMIKLVPLLMARNPTYVREHICIDSSPGDYLATIMSLLANGAEDLVRLTPYSREQADVVQELVKRATTNSWNRQFERVVKALKTFQSGWDWTDLIAAVSSQLGKSSLDGLGVEAYINTLHFLLRGIDDLAVVLQDLATEQALQNYDSLDKTNLDVSGRFASLLLVSQMPLVESIPEVRVQYGYHYQPQTTPLQPSQVQANSARRSIKERTRESGVGFVELKQAAFYLGDLSMWLEASENDADRIQFVKSMARSEPVSTLTANNLSTVELLKKEEFWRSTLGKERFHEELEGAAARNTLAHSLLSLPFGENLDDICIVALKKESSEELRQAVTGYLQRLDTQAWQVAFSEKSARITLASETNTSYLEIAFEKALIDQAKSELSGANACTKSFNNAALLSALTEINRPLFLSQLVNFFATENVQFSSGIPCWGELLISGLLQEGPTRAQSRLLETVKRADPVELKWLGDLMVQWDKSDPKAQQMRKLLKKELSVLDKQSLSVPQQQSLDQFSGRLGRKALPGF